MESQDNSGLDSSSEVLSTATKNAPAKTKTKKKDHGPLWASLLCFPALIVALAAIVMSVLGFLSQPGDFGWFCEICASLRAQYVLILLFCMLPALFSPPWRIPLLSACSVFLLINLCLVAPCLLPPATQPQANLKFLKFKIHQIHINNSEADLKGLLNEIGQEKAEVVCISGLTTAQFVKFNEWLNSYLHRTAFMADEGKGIAVYSTIPLKGNRFRKMGPDKLPVLLTTIHFDYGWFRIVVMELPAPNDAASLLKRNQTSDEVAKLVGGLSGRKILVGNYNMTPYSMAFANMLKTGGLSDSRMGFGVQPNWHYPENLDLFVLRLPVDHILINSDVATMSRHIGEPCGLTHRPIIAELYPASSNQPKYDPSKESAPDDVPASQFLTGGGVKPVSPVKPAEGESANETTGKKKRKKHR